MRVRVVSDGTPEGTRVTDAEGRQIHGVASVSWQVDRKTGLARVVLGLEDVEIAANGAVRFACATTNTCSEERVREISARMEPTLGFSREMQQS